jgi:hypothetical protein
MRRIAPFGILERNMTELERPRPLQDRAERVKVGCRLRAKVTVY